MKCEYDITMSVRKTARQIPTITSIKRAVLAFWLPSLSFAGGFSGDAIMPIELCVEAMCL